VRQLAGLLPSLSGHDIAVLSRLVSSRRGAGYARLVGKVGSFDHSHVVCCGARWCQIKVSNPSFPHLTSVATPAFLCRRRVDYAARSACAGICYLFTTIRTYLSV
jgi:hypothetical protein